MEYSFDINNRAIKAIKTNGVYAIHIMPLK